MQKAELESLICELLEINSVNHMIKTQITRFTVKHGYSYKDIGRALYYFVKVQKRMPNADMGIGIVPHVKEASTKYFTAMKIKQQQQSVQAEEIRLNKNKKQTIIIASPTRKDRGRNIIDMEDL